ncbi:MAG: YjjI family glycine radical enzyme [Spirochaetales bacterium]|nr:YjjI family glycine radical enzyme [Spirochaetales bacterium]
MSQTLDIIKDKTLTYHQQVFNLAREAENSVSPLMVSDRLLRLKEEGVICDLFEGQAPYRPRYIIPDYSRLMSSGCEFLRINAPRDIWEATHALLIFYKHVPSIDYFPVYLGNLDTLLQPFIKDEEEARKAIRLFLEHIDRTLTGSFVHANVGPEESPAGRIIVETVRDMDCAIPNLTLKYDKDKTSDSFLNLCCASALSTAKPSFANHSIYSSEFSFSGYAIASCYNGLPLAGGGYTLVRLRLNTLAEQAKSLDHYLEQLLPEAASEQLAYMDERIRFLNEESGFFESSFLVQEGFIRQDRFTGMFGLVGLAEAVNLLMEKEGQAGRFGSDARADETGLTVIKKLSELVESHHSPYVGCFDGRHLLHAQVGIDNDKGSSPGCRIPVGEEPETLPHILQSAPFHKYFPSGTGDIFVFDQTWKNKPEALADIVRGAMASGLRYFSAYSEDCDVVRVTGYLVKRSEMDKLDQGKAVLNQSTILGLGIRRDGDAFNRPVRAK